MDTSSRPETTPASRPTRRRFLSGLSAGVASLGLGPVKAAAAPGDDGVLVLLDRMTPDAWASYLGEQDPRWSELPPDFYSSPFLGNGGLGVSVYRHPSSRRLKIEVGDTRVRDHQSAGGVLFGGARLRIGYFLLDTTGEITDVDLRLSLRDAELAGTLTTTAGTLRLNVLVHASKDLLLASVTPDAGESGTGWTFVPYPAASPRLAFQPRPAGLQDNPAPVLEQDAAGGSCRQDLVAGGGHATVWRHTTEDGTRQLLASVAASYPDSTAYATARAAVTAGAAQPVDRLRGEHRRWWHAFYPKSLVSVPDGRLQSFYWIQLYKVACTTRRDRPVISTMGQWLEPTPWPAAWWNLNVQLSYWLINATGHTELDSLSRSLDEHRDSLAENVRPAYRHDSYAIARTAHEDLRSGYAGVPGQSGGEFGTPEVGNLLWAVHNLWLSYRHGMDPDQLRYVVYPVLRRTVNYYLQFLTEGADGRLHLPLTYSPEYASTRDCNYDLALLSWGCRTLLSATERLGVADPLRSRWQDVADRLVDPPQGPDGLWIGADRQLTSSHRHYSHLLWFYPLYLLDPTEPAARDLLERSLAHWVGFTGALQGYTFTGAASMSAAMGKGDDALRYLDTLQDRYVQPNTMYRESGPVLETPLSGAQSLHDMLLQSWGGVVRVFPAVPAAWADVQVHDLRTEGAFLVSARRTGGVTRYVRVRSLAGEPLRLAHGIPGPVTVRRVQVAPAGGAGATAPPVAWRDLGGGVAELDLAAADDVVLFATGDQPDLVVQPVEVTKPARPWGVPGLPKPEGEIVPVDLSALFDNDGIATASNPSDGNFDGSGYTYPADQLPPVGTFRHSGVDFAFPSGADGVRNNLTSRGVTIAVPPGRYRRLRFLGACSSGTAVLDAVARYADGSTAPVRLALSDWGRQPSYGESVAVLTTHRLSPTGPHGLQVRIFHQVADVDPQRELVSLTMPVRTGPLMHLFALGAERG